MSPGGVALTLWKALLLTWLSLASARQPYIIGGQDAKAGDWPWQGSLQFLWQHLCGCTLISDRWLVTAGHCLDTMEFDPKYMHVLLGANDLFTKREGAPKHYHVKQIYRHPNYYENLAWNKIRNDIGLIELKDRVQTGLYVKPIALPVQGDSTIGDVCYISGWGGTEMIDPGQTDPPKTPNMLQETPVIEVSFNDCNMNYGEVDQTQQICVNYEKKAGSCTGDSGGPLVCKDGPQSDTWKLYGATSFGERHCNPMYASVYTRVAYYRDWIHDVSGV